MTRDDPELVTMTHKPDQATEAVAALPDDAHLFTVDSLAAALHAWRKTQTLAGCGWKFATVIEGKAYCPCPADAAAILKAAKEASE